MIDILPVQIKAYCIMQASFASMSEQLHGISCHPQDYPCLASTKNCIILALQACHNTSRSLSPAHSHGHNHASETQPCNHAQTPLSCARKERSLQLSVPFLDILALETQQRRHTCWLCEHASTPVCKEHSLQSSVPCSGHLRC